MKMNKQYRRIAKEMDAHLAAQRSRPDHAKKNRWAVDAKTGARILIDRFGFRVFNQE